MERIIAMAEELERGEGDPHRSRVALDARKYAASRLNPQEFGDRIQQDINITDVGKLHLEELKKSLKGTGNKPNKPKYVTPKHTDYLIDKLKDTTTDI